MLNGNHDGLKALPPPKGMKRRSNPLASLGGLTREACKIYKAMKKGTMDHEKGRSLVWVLSQMRAMVEAQSLERIEHRLEQLSNAPPASVYHHEEPKALVAH